MRLFFILRSALRSLLANRMRSALTMLGVVIGVGAVVAMIALGQGAQESVQRSIQSLGTNLLTIRPGSASQGGIRGGTVETLTEEDSKAVAAIEGVAAVAPEVSRQAQVQHLSANSNSTIEGVTPEYMGVRAFTMERGDFISEVDVRMRRRVAVLGANVAQELFGGLDPLGERIKIRGVSFVVQGLLAAKGDSGFASPDDMVIVPISTNQHVLFGIDSVGSIGVQVAQASQMTRVQREIDRILRIRHRIAPGADADFNVRSQTEMMQTMSQITGTFTALLGGVAAVSLIVGGIGIMNIMLVAVRERTREIGIRKAVGARGRDILLQFLVEAIVVSLAGGGIGIGLGYGGSEAMTRLAGINTSVPLYAVVLAVTTSTLIGIVFGVWPARQAARLDPVEALRYE